MKSRIRRMIYVCLFAVTTAVMSVPAHAQTFRAVGPFFYAYVSDGLNYYWGSVSVDVVSDAGPGAYLNYWILDQVTGQFETFMGSIPAASITYSGGRFLHYGGNYAVHLVVDTRNMVGDQKTGSGGLIDLRLAQRADASVYTSTGESVQDRGYLIYRQVGKTTYTEPGAISGTVLGIEWGTARFDNESANVGFRNNGSVTIESKKQ